MAGKLIGAHDGRADSNYSLLCQLEYKNKTQLPCHQGDCNLEAKSGKQIDTCNLGCSVLWWREIQHARKPGEAKMLSHESDEVAKGMGI